MWQHSQKPHGWSSSVGDTHHGVVYTIPVHHLFVAGSLEPFQRDLKKHLFFLELLNEVKGTLFCNVTVLWHLHIILSEGELEVVVSVL